MTHRFSRFLSVSLLIVLCSCLFTKSVFGHEISICFTDEYQKVYNILSQERIGIGKSEHHIARYKPKHITNYRKWKMGLLRTGSLPENEARCVYHIAMRMPMDPPIDDWGCRSNWRSGYAAAIDLISKANSLIYCLYNSENEDDCDSEFNDVERDHDYYSSVIWDIESSCDE